MKKKYDSIISLHIRFDADTHDTNVAEQITEELGRRITQFVRTQMHNTEQVGNWYQVQFVETPAEVDRLDSETEVPRATITYAGVQAYASDSAGANRHHPNVFWLGRLLTTSQSIREWNYQCASNNISDPELARRARPFNVMENIKDGPVRLPSLPFSSVRNIIQSARQSYSDDIWTVWSKRITETTVDTLEGLFEDGLPIDSEASEPTADLF